MLPKLTLQRERRIEGKKFHLYYVYESKLWAKRVAKEMAAERKKSRTTFQYRIVPVQYNHLRGMRTGYAVYSTYKAPNLA